MVVVVGVMALVISRLIQTVYDLLPGSGTAEWNVGLQSAMPQI